VIAAITLTLLVTNCPHFISVSYSSVDWTVATKAERDQTVCGGLQGWSWNRTPDIASHLAAAPARDHLDIPVAGA